VCLLFVAVWLCGCFAVCISVSVSVSVSISFSVSLSLSLSLFFSVCLSSPFRSVTDIFTHAQHNSRLCMDTH